MLRRTFLKIGAAALAAAYLPFKAVVAKAAAKRASQTHLWVGGHNSDFADARNWFDREVPKDGDSVIFSSTLPCDATAESINLDTVIVTGRGDVGLPRGGTIKTLKQYGGTVRLP